MNSVRISAVLALLTAIGSLGYSYGVLHVEIDKNRKSLESLSVENGKWNEQLEELKEIKLKLESANPAIKALIVASKQISPERIKALPAHIVELDRALAKVADKLGEFEHMPVGTIVLSSLDERQMLAEEGMNSFDVRTSKWCLADGRSVVGSNYKRTTNKDNAPDLRGVFVRGINSGKSGDYSDPEGDRSPGSLQRDSFQGHFHSLPENVASTSHSPGTSHPHGLANGGHTHGVSTVTGPRNDGLSGEPRVANETRPKNAAVFFYIRIN